MEKKMNRCLNCGTLCSDNYCPHCGQSTKVGRFDCRLFFINVISDISRVSATYFTTAYGLMTHPWKIINDYVRGKRVRYVAPLTMLLLTTLYLSIIISFSEYNFKYIQTDSQNPFIRIITDTLNNSLALQFLMYSPVIAATTYIVYYRNIRLRFNFFEICIAVFFYISTFMLYNIVAFPLELINIDLCNLFILISVAIVGVTGLLKAFPQTSIRKTILKLTIWTALNVALATTYTLCLIKLIYYAA